VVFRRREEEEEEGEERREKGEGGVKVMAFLPLFFSFTSKCLGKYPAALGLLGIWGFGDFGDFGARSGDTEKERIGCS